MNNKKLYKQSMSGVQHSNQVVERIFEMTIDKKKKSKFSIKPIASVALAFAILIGGGLGANAIIKSEKDIPNNIIANQPLSVMVAYAGEKYYTAGSINEQSVFYSIHYASVDDKDALSKAKQQYDKDYISVLNNAEKLAENGFSASGGGGSQGCWSTIEDRNTAIMYTVRGGSIALSLDDYTNVKALTVENNSDYGILYMSYNASEGDAIDDTVGTKITISGDELRTSKSSGIFEIGTSKKVNKGYKLNWNPSDELYSAIGDNLNFDLSQIKDTITFTVEFNDGTKQKASLKLYFDSDGYMHFE